MSGQPGSQRIKYVDAMRGAAVLAMFFVHSAGAWLSPEIKGTPYWIWSMRVSGMVAPVFLFLVGISLAVIAHRAGDDSTRQHERQLSAMLRGVKILLLGYLLHGAFFLFNGFGGPAIRILKVDILHCIGLGMFLFCAIAWPSKAFNWQALALFFLLPLLGYAAYSSSIDKQLPSWLAAYLTTKPKLALFPIIPYGAWIALGLAVGPIWVRARQEATRERRFWLALITVSVALLIIGRAIKVVSYHTALGELLGAAEQTRGLYYLFFYKGGIVFLLFAFFRLLEPIWSGPILLLGRTSLFAYAVHLPIIYHLVGYFAKNALSPRLHIIGATALTVVMCLLCYGWSTRKRWWPEHLSYPHRSV